MGVLEGVLNKQISCKKYTIFTLNCNEMKQKQFNY